MPAQRPARIMSSIMGKRHTHTLPRYEKHWHANCHFSACNIATRFSFANSNVASAMFCISEYLYLINLVLDTPSIILFFCWPYGNLHKFSQRVISCNVNECTKCRALMTAAEMLNNMQFWGGWIVGPLKMQDKSANCACHPISGEEATDNQYS